MFKLFAFIAALTVVAAHPGILSASTPVRTVNTVLGNIPTSITHQSQTQIHTQPIVRRIVSPVIRTIASPIIVHETRPIISTSFVSRHIPVIQAMEMGMPVQNTNIEKEPPLMTEETPVVEHHNTMMEEQIQPDENPASAKSGHMDIIEALRLLSNSLSSKSIELKNKHKLGHAMRANS